MKLPWQRAWPLDFEERSSAILQKKEKGWGEKSKEDSRLKKKKKKKNSWGRAPGGTGAGLGSSLKDPKASQKGGKEGISLSQPINPKGAPSSF